MTIEGSLPSPHPAIKAASVMDSSMWKEFARQRLAWYIAEAKGHSDFIVFPGPGALSLLSVPVFAMQVT